MSEYLRSLQAPAKTYLRKLNLLGLDDTDDPYCDASSKFRDDMTGEACSHVAAVLFKVAGNPAFSRSTNLESKLIEFFVFVNV